MTMQSQKLWLLQHRIPSRHLYKGSTQTQCRVVISNLYNSLSKLKSYGPIAKLAKKIIVFFGWINTSFYYMLLFANNPKMGRINNQQKYIGNKF